MAASKATPPSSRCIVLSSVEAPNVTSFVFTDEWENAMLSLGVDSEQFPPQNYKLPPPPLGMRSKTVSLIKCIF